MAALHGLGLSDESFEMLSLDESEPFRIAAFSEFERRQRAGALTRSRFNDRLSFTAALKHILQMTNASRLIVFFLEAELTGAVDLPSDALLTYADGLLAIYSEGIFAVSRTIRDGVLLDWVEENGSWFFEVFSWTSEHDAPP